MAKKKDLRQEEIMVIMANLTDDEKAEMKRIVGNDILGGRPLKGHLLSKALVLKLVFRKTGRLKPHAYGALFGDYPVILGR